MSGSGLGDFVHGANLPSPRWWRPFRDIPLIILLCASIVAAVVGWVVQARLDADAAAIAPVAASGASGLNASVCRPTLSPLESEPWLDNPDAAEARWDAASEELPGPVVAGRNGWAFYNDQIEENFSQAVGRRLLTVSEVDAWVDYFSRIAEGLAERDIDLTIQITPSASSVYPQMLPEWTDDIRGSTPLDQLLAAAPGLPIIDFRADLRDASKDMTVFTPVNSHWTDLGGYIGWQTFAECNRQLYPSASPIYVPALAGTADGGIFNEYAPYGVPDIGPEWSSPVYAEQLPQYELTSSTGEQETREGGEPIDLSLLPAETSSDESYSSDTALILRDSMGNALSGLWAVQFAHTWQIQSRYDNWSQPPAILSLADQHQVNVVIIQLAERHLVNAPPPGVVY